MMKDESQNDLYTFFKKIDFDWETFIVEPGGGTQIYDCDSGRFDISPKEFLKYAIQDCRSADCHGFVNALSNVKRAIECQCDVIHFSLGIPYEKLNFPKKVENLQAMGISPSVLFKNINAIRVELEHFYKRPDPGRVSDAIEIAQLFLDLTTLCLTNFWEDFTFIPEDHEKAYRLDNTQYIPFEAFFNAIRFGYERKDKRFKVVCIKDGEYDEIIYVDSKNVIDYMKIIHLAVNIGKNIHNFDEELGKQIFNEWFSNLSEPVILY